MGTLPHRHGEIALDLRPDPVVVVLVGVVEVLGRLADALLPVHQQTAAHPIQEVFGYADDIEAVSVEVPGLVVEAILGEDAAPREVVLELLADAAAVRQGRHPDPGGLPDLVDAAREQVARLPAGQREEVLAGLLARVTPLDPLRSARDLLEHLLDGMRGCLLVYREEGVSQATEDLDDADEDDYDRIGAKVEGEFAAAVRQRAHQDRARLT